MSLEIIKSKKRTRTFCSLSWSSSNHAFQIVRSKCPISSGKIFSVLVCLWVIELWCGIAVSCWKLLLPQTYFTGFILSLCILFFLYECSIYKLAGHHARSSCGSRWFYLWSEVFERMVWQWTWHLTNDKFEPWTLQSCSQPCSSFRHSGVATKTLKSTFFFSLSGLRIVYMFSFDCQDWTKKEPIPTSTNIPPELMHRCILYLITY